MSYDFPYIQAIDLHVKDRISETDADRQSRTAVAILKKLKEQPGVILADEVGMGKTFVALAVVVILFVVDVPNGIVCQYQVIPPAGAPVLVNVTPVGKHCGLLLVGFAGFPGEGLTVTVKLPSPVLQHNEVLFLALI